MLSDVVDLIREEMETREWTPGLVALKMSDYEAQRLTLDLLLAARDQASISMGEETAGRLAKAFGVDKEFLLRLEAAPSPVPVQEPAR